MKITRPILRNQSGARNETHRAIGLFYFGNHTTRPQQLGYLAHRIGSISR